MPVKYLTEMVFLQEVEAAGQVWVARSSHNSVYAMELEETGLSLPVWSKRERVDEFLRNSMLIGPKYEPYAVPVKVFTNTWLPDKSRDIFELLINPDGRT